MSNKKEIEEYYLNIKKIECYEIIQIWRNIPKESFVTDEEKLYLDIMELFCKVNALKVYDKIIGLLIDNGLIQGVKKDTKRGKNFYIKYYVCLLLNEFEQIQKRILNELEKYSKLKHSRRIRKEIKKQQKMIKKEFDKHSKRIHIRKRFVKYLKRFKKNSIKNLVKFERHYKRLRK